jgi:hypothetical protein
MERLKPTNWRIVGMIRMMIVWMAIWKVDSLPLDGELTKTTAITEMMNNAT